jgi:hypothetical protein
MENKNDSKRIRMTPTIEDHAVDILKKAGQPMHYKEIMAEVLRRRPFFGREWVQQNS